MLSAMRTDRTALDAIEKAGHHLDEKIEELAAHHGGHAHWSHDTKGVDGPAYWGELGYKISDKGIRQSPINIISKSAITSPGLNAIGFHYDDTEFTLKNNGHTIQVDCADLSNTITINDKNYDLLQFHFHARSEHLINGDTYPMELHFVHILSGAGATSDKSAAKLAVVGVMIKQGEENELIAKLWKKLPAKDGKVEFTDSGLNFSKLLPKRRSFYRYLGSLTTPPCTENVLWSVMEEPIEFSKEQIEDFKKLYKDNYRPAQEVNQRTILRYTDGQPSSTVPDASPVAPSGTQ